MRIGIISNLYPPNERGGAELVANRVAHALSARGHEVSILTSKPFSGWKSFSPRCEEKHLERVYRFAPFNVYGIHGKTPTFFPVKLLWHMIDLLSPFSKSILHWWIVQEQPDVLITHNLKGIGLSLSRHIQEESIFHIRTLHDLQLSVPSGLLIWGEEDSFLNRSFLRDWYERAVTWAIGKPNLMISPSKFLIDAYHERGMFLDVPFKLLPNPAPSHFKTDYIERAPSNRGTPGPIKLLFAGQLESHKGILFLLEVLKKFSVPFELHIAGDGSLRSLIEERCRQDKRLTYHGFVAFAQLTHLIAIADTCIVPSLCYENSPTIIYESFSIGVPVIASNIGGIPELISEGENGFLFEPGNIESCLAALNQIVKTRIDPDIIRTSAEKYSLKKYVDQIESVILSSQTINN